MFFKSRLIIGVLLIVFCTNLNALEKPEPDWSRVGITDSKQAPEYWLKRAPNSNTALLNTTNIAARNTFLLRNEPTMVDWSQWPASLDSNAIRNKIEAISKRPSKPLYQTPDVLVSNDDIDKWFGNLNLNHIKASNDQLFGIVVVRSALRRFPTEQRAFDANGGIDIDRLQESALFPGSPVAILHQSRDQQWLFVQAENYAAWVKSKAIAIGTRQQVFEYVLRQPRLHVTGSQVRTVFHPHAKDLSELTLDMGSSFPIRTDWPIAKPVNDQGSLGSWVVDFPMRSNLGSLQFKQALIPRSADTATALLPASQANIIRQRFKFIGERYGWGHDYNARDCSGFVSEVYQSMGILLPRNTSDQAKSLAFEREAMDAEITRSERIERIKKLQIGDLVFIPGHVMMVVGLDEYGPWVIHDSHKTGFVLDAKYFSFPTNGVAVTPLMNMALSADKSYIDAITSIQHIFPRQ
ncbi:MAG TPA: SH3 domain-containing protein [Arenimonas sp.]|nr:SH3 domain-containing protein [Arenimonas sp.]